MSSNHIDIRSSSTVFGNWLKNPKEHKLGDKSILQSYISSRDGPDKRTETI